MQKRHTNISRRERSSKPPKPEFSLFGVLAGMVAGWLSGFGMELALNRPAKLVMLVSGFSGVALGTGLEGIRYWLRLRRFNAARQTRDE